MSQPGPEPTATPAAAPVADPKAAEQAVVRAIVDHHARLAAGLDERVEALVHLVETDHLPRAETARADLVEYLDREIVPHARAEEQALYPPAAALAEGRLLVDGMIAEHHALTALVGELSGATSVVRAVAAARAVAALFAVHLVKENDLVLPLLAAAPGVKLAQVLAGMHELLGEAGDGHAEAAPAAGGCGGGGACGCGGDDDAGPLATTPVLTVDSRLDVREVPHGQRHPLVMSTVEALLPGEAVVLVASHAPRPVLAEVDARLPGQVRTQWLQSGPRVWQVRLERLTPPAHR